jgi:hypothetical protein
MSAAFQRFQNRGAAPQAAPAAPAQQPAPAGRGGRFAPRQAPQAAPAQAPTQGGFQGRGGRPAQAPRGAYGGFGGDIDPAGAGRLPKLVAGHSYEIEYKSCKVSDDSGKPWGFVYGIVRGSDDPNAREGEERLAIHQCLVDKRVAGSIIVRAAMCFMGLDPDSAEDTEYYKWYSNGGALTNIFIGYAEEGSATDPDGNPFPSFVGTRAIVRAFAGKAVEGKPGEFYVNTSTDPLPPAEENAGTP